MEQLNGRAESVSMVSLNNININLLNIIVCISFRKTQWSTKDARATITIW